MRSCVRVCVRTCVRLVFVYAVLLPVFTSSTIVTRSCALQIARKNAKHYREPRKSGATTQNDVKDAAAKTATNFPTNVSFVHVSQTYSALGRLPLVSILIGKYVRATLLMLRWKVFNHTNIGSHFPNFFWHCVRSCFLLPQPVMRSKRDNFCNWAIAHKVGSIHSLLTRSPSSKSPAILRRRRLSRLLPAGQLRDGV